MVLVSNEETRQMFTDALEMMGRKEPEESPLIYHVKDYRGCEDHGVMCVGVEDAWMVEGISRAIHTLFIIDGGTAAAVRSRMGLWMEMERRGFLVHRPLPSSNDCESHFDGGCMASIQEAIASLSNDDWRTLNARSVFLKVPDPVLDPMLVKLSHLFCLSSF